MDRSTPSVSRLTRRLSVIAASGTLVLAVVGPASAHPSLLRSVSFQGDALWTAAAARILALDPETTPDELDEVIGGVMDDLDDDADQPESAVDEGTGQDATDAQDATDGGDHEAAKPEVVKPKTEKPRTEKPKTHKPTAATHETTKPKSAKSDDGDQGDANDQGDDEQGDANDHGDDEQGDANDQGENEHDSSDHGGSSADGEHDGSGHDD